MNQWEERSAKLYESYVKEYQEAGAGDRSEYLALRMLCLTDLGFLAREVFNLKNAKGLNGRKRWYPPIHERLCDHLQKPEDSLIHLSRGMMKTTVGIVWLVQTVLRDPGNVRIGLWSKSAKLVESELKMIKNAFLNKKLLELFPDRLIADTQKWEVNNSTQMTITRDVEEDEEIPVDQKRELRPNENQIEVWGVGSTATGRHYDFHYYDDVIDDKNVSTADQIGKIRDWWGAVQAIKDPGAIEKIIGTPWHQMDLYATIREDNLFEKEQIITIPGATEDGNILYPFFTKDFLNKQERIMGPYLYAAQYCLNTLPKSDRMFIPPYPQYLAGDFPNDPAYYISVDPSTGRSKRHDKTGICVAAVSESAPDRLYFVEAEGYALRTEQLADKLVELTEKYQPRRIGIEKNLLYEGLEALYELKFKERREKMRHPEFWPVSQGGGAGSPNKADKINRTIGAMVRDQRALFLPGMKTLFKQMSFFNPNAQKNDDDVLDAAGMMVQTVPYFAPAHWMGNGREAQPYMTVKQWDGLFFPTKQGNIRDRVFSN